MLGINQFNEFLLFRNTGSGWTSRPLAIGVPDAPNVGVAAFVDPATGRAYAVLSTSESLRLFIISDAVLGENTEIWLTGFPQSRMPIERGLTVFTNADGIVHIVGIDANDDVIIYYRNPSFNGMVVQGWNHNNLSNHLEDQQLATPAI